MHLFYIADKKTHTKNLDKRIGLFVSVRVVRNGIVYTLSDCTHNMVAGTWLGNHQGRPSAYTSKIWRVIKFHLLTYLSSCPYVCVWRFVD